MMSYAGEEIRQGCRKGAEEGEGWKEKGGEKRAGEEETGAILLIFFTIF